MFPQLDFSAATKAKQLNPQAAFIGLVGDSLFAMSPERYPLVMFDDARNGHLRPTVGAPHASWEKMTEVDKLTEHRKWKKLCGVGKSMDPRCLTGVCSLELTGQSRLRRLLEGPDAIPESATTVGAHVIVDAISIVPEEFPSETATTGGLDTLNRLVSSEHFAYGITLSLLTAVLFLLFMLMRNQTSPTPPQIIHKSFDQVHSPPEAYVDLTSNAAHHIPLTILEKSSVTELKTPIPKMTPSSFQLPYPTDSSTKDKTVYEGGKENGEVPATPGKRRPTRRGRRGKKKGAVGNGGTGGEEEDDRDEFETKDGDEVSSNGRAEGSLSATLAVVPIG
jgi:serine/threonine-protein kinase/endoribonuclease IRE1